MTGYMRTNKVYINNDHPLRPYVERITALANNLSNAALFRERQAMTAVDKPEAEWTDNERQVMNELHDAKRLRGGKWKLPEKGKAALSSGCLDDVMKACSNPDYYAEGLPRQSAQHVLKQVAADMFSFLKACAAFKEKPSAFTGKPELPHYKRKGGHATVYVSNQDCQIKVGPDGKWYAYFPFKKDTPLCIGMPIPDARLKEATITPRNGRYEISFKFEMDKELPEPQAVSSRICAIDFGVDNLMAVTNNCGLPCVLYKGGVPKSINQQYNKQAADIVSKQTLETGKKFIPTEEYYAVTNRRNDRIDDCFKKCAKHFVAWCVENRIDTVVMGVNRLWKQKSELGHKNNQEFVQLPFFKLRSIIRYLCEWNGIRCVEQEESYTSKASFLDMDPIPVYGGEDSPRKPLFSGKRRPYWYHGNYKGDGFRGLYTSADGTIINSDLNGSANILRKAFLGAFQAGQIPDFSTVEVIKHPDLEKQKANREKQLAKGIQPNGEKHVSRSRQKREHRKQNLRLSSAA